MRVCVGLALSVALGCAAPPAGDRVEAVKRRGTIGCGVEPTVPGFAEVDGQGRYRGLDVDMCRAVAAAIFGTPDRVTFVRAPSVTSFRDDDAIDMVSRRITWELRREIPYGLLFGPIMFYDGQGFLVAKSLGAGNVKELARHEICVAGAAFDSALSSYFAGHGLPLKKTVLLDPHDLRAIVDEINSGACRAYSADVSLLGAVRSKLAKPGDFDILGDQISREPLAQLVRQEDTRLFSILRWTISALVNAEELGVTSANVDEMKKSSDPDVRRLLGITPGNGKALGLGEDWAYNAIKSLGNYGEVFEQNVGRGSPLGLDRGLNRLWTNGGLMYAPPLR